MEPRGDKLGKVLRLVPREALHKVPDHNRKRLLELNAFFADNFGIVTDKSRFGGLALSLATNDHAELGTLHRAASAIAKQEWKGVSDLAPEKLIDALDAGQVEHAFFLSVLKALENNAIMVDAALVRDLFAFQGSVFKKSLSGARAFTSGASLAMLENSNCTPDWVSEQTAFRLATLSDKIIVRDRAENGKRFKLLAAVLRKHTFAPKRLGDMVETISRAPDVPHALGQL